MIIFPRGLIAINYLKLVSAGLGPPITRNEEVQPLAPSAAPAAAPEPPAAPLPPAVPQAPSAAAVGTAKKSVYLRLLNSNY